MMVPEPQVIRRVGGLDALVEVSALVGKHVLIVSDAGLVAAGHAERARAFCAVRAERVSEHFGVQPEPGAQDVEACLKACQGVDVIVAIGGGSVMDVAKLSALVTDTSAALEAHAGRHDTRRGPTSLVLIPTSAGTGSEAQAAAILSDEGHRKRAYLAPGLGADVVILDPKLTLSCPEAVSVASGLDALTHALEVFVTKARTPKSDALALSAFTRINAALPRVLDAPSDLEAREAMLYAAHDAGLAIAHSMLGAAHAAGNALSARYGLVHGVAVASMLPAVVAYNAEVAENAERYEVLAEAAGLGRSVEALTTRLEALLALGAIAAPPIKGEDIGALAREASSQWTGTFNPRPMDEASFARLFEAAR